MRKIHATQQFFENSCRHRDFFEKTKKPVCRYGLGECVYQISGLYSLAFGQEVPYKPTNTFTSENRNVLYWLLASRGF